jgi:hypothetical protein
MPKTAPARKDRKDDEYKWRDTTWKRAQQWRIWENVGLKPVMTLHDLDIQWADPRVRGLDIIGATRAVTMERTIDGASTLTIEVLDPFSHIFSQAAKRYIPHILTPKERRAAKLHKFKAAEVDEGWEPMLPPDLRGQACEVKLQGARFRLVKVSYSYAEDSASLVFEDLIVYLLKRKRGERRASRRKVTRAQFILSQLREIKTIKPPFICPELLVKQPIDKQDTTGSATTKRSSGGGSGGDAGFSPNAKLFGMDHTGARYPISGDLRRNCERVLTEADKITGSLKPRLALVEACNVENHWSNAAMGDADSEGILQVRVGIHGSNATNIEWCVDRFLKGPSWTGAYGGKGAIDLAKAFPSWSEGKIAQTIQGSAYPSRYDKTKPAAVELLRQWGGAGGSAEGTASSYEVSYNRAYQFARDKNESAYTSIKRLADDVNWKFFPVGEAVYYMSEEQLFNRRVRYTFRPGDNAVLDLTFDADWGKPVSECVVTVALDRWGAPPGAVVVLEGWEVPDGRWLITSIRRDWFKPIAEVTLSQPGKAALEPAEEKASRTITTPGGTQSGAPDSGSKVGDMIAWAKKFTGSYLYGGGHGPALSSLGVGDRLDCSSSTSLALYKAGMWDSRSTARVSGDFASWGVAGEGESETVWYNGGHVFTIFRGQFSGRFDTGGPGGGAGPRYRAESRSTAGFSPRHWPGT